jgi:hypothetical protein
MGISSILGLSYLLCIALHVAASTGLLFSKGSMPLHSRHHRSPTFLAALRVTIHIRGRGRGGEKWLEVAYEQYEERLKPAGLDLVTVS